MHKTSWYRSWFNSPYYHILYKNRDEREAAQFIDRALKYFNPQVGAKFLDMACGKGRHSIYINKKGYDVTGIDLSEENIKIASQAQNEHLHFAVHDMREPYDHLKFDYVFNLFTSFGYFPSIDENEKVLRASHHNLKLKGKILIDFLNVNQVIADLVQDEIQEIEGITFKISREIEDGIIKKNIDITDGNHQIRFVERVRALTRQDFAGMLSRCDFEILDTFGNYNLDEFDPNESPRLILIARKRK